MATYIEIQNELKKPLPDEKLATRKAGKEEITYIPWHVAADILDETAPGWQGEVDSIVDLDDALAVTYALTIRGSDISVTHTDTGFELKSVSGYGDPVSNATAMAFRRAAAKHGLGRYLYRKDKSDAAWDGVLWYGNAKGKHYTDPAVDVSSLNWGAEHTKYPAQKEMLLAEVGKRTASNGASTKSSGDGGVAVVTNGGRVGLKDIADLKRLATIKGLAWEDVKAKSGLEFDEAEISKLSPRNFLLLKTWVEVG